MAEEEFDIPYWGSYEMILAGTDPSIIWLSSIINSLTLQKLCGETLECSEAYLIGSCARGGFNSWSDIDNSNHR